MALLKGTGWTDTATGIFEAAGGLASGIKNWLSGRTKENREAVQAEQAAQAQAIADYQLGEQQQETTKLEIAAFFKRYGLWIGLAIGGIVVIWLLIKFVFKRKRTSVVRRRSVTRSFKPRSRGKRSGTKSSGSKSFKRRIGNKVFTSAKAWSQEMRKRRKK